MASRSTRQEAEKIKAETEARHPGVEIRILDNSGTAQIGRMIAEREGFEILSGNDITVTVRETRFEILEVRKCRCGAEVLTAAIGESGLNECSACREKRQERQKREGQARAERKAGAREESQAFDSFWG